MESKRLSVGDKVKFVKEYRPIKKGKTKEEYLDELKQLRRGKKLTSEDYTNIIDKYFQKKFKTKSGISKITEIDTYWHREDKELPIYYILANGERLEETEIERIPIHKEFSELLDNAYCTDSFLTRTGLLYRIGDTIILEYMRSTKNVWVDKQIAEQFSKEEYKDIEKEIKHFFNNDVKDISFGLELNEHVNTFNNTIKEIFKQYSLEINK